MNTTDSLKHTRFYKASILVLGGVFLTGLLYTALGPDSFRSEFTTWVRTKPNPGFLWLLIITTTISGLFILSYKGDRQRFRVIAITVLLLAFFGLFVFQPTFAAQQVEGDPDVPLRVIASLDNPNRLSIKDGRFISAYATDDLVNMEADLESGEIIFKPLGDEEFSIFARAESGVTYTVVVRSRKELVGQSIVISENLSTTHQYDRDVKVVSFKNQVNQLVKSIEGQVGAAKLPGFRLTAVNREVRLWKETTILHALSWSQGNLIIDKYVITNVSDSPLGLHEREFADLSKNIRAISIRDHALLPAKSTVLYTFRNPS